MLIKRTSKSPTLYQLWLCTSSNILRRPTNPKEPANRYCLLCIKGGALRKGFNNWSLRERKKLYRLGLCTSGSSTASLRACKKRMSRGEIHLQYTFSLPYDAEPLRAQASTPIVGARVPCHACRCPSSIKAITFEAGVDQEHHAHRKKPSSRSLSKTMHCG